MVSISVSDRFYGVVEFEVGLCMVFCVDEKNFILMVFRLFGNMGKWLFGL